jgi:hypothetical protein
MTGWISTTEVSEIWHRQGVTNPTLGMTGVECLGVLYFLRASRIVTVPLEASFNDLEFLGVPRTGFERWCDEFGVPRLKTVPRRFRPEA